MLHVILSQMFRVHCVQCLLSEAKVVHSVSLCEMICVATTIGVFARQYEETTGTTSASSFPLNVPIDDGSFT